MTLIVETLECLQILLIKVIKNNEECGLSQHINETNFIAMPEYKLRHLKFTQKHSLLIKYVKKYN